MGTCIAKDPLSFVAFASDETLERHQVKVHGAEPSEKLKKIIEEEEKKAVEDELDVADMSDGGMDFGSDSEEEVKALPVANKPSLGANKMATIKANMAAQAIEKTAAPAVVEEAKVEEVVAKVEELKWKNQLSTLSKKL